MLPGFQDSHNHLIWSAAQAEDISLADVSDEAGRRAPRSSRRWPRFRPTPGCAAAAGASPSTRVPTAAALDAITGDRPAYFDDVDVHSGWANSAALKRAGITAATKDPAGGRIERDAAGNPTGMLRENAMYLVSKLMPAYPDAQVDKGLEKAQAEAIGYGITAMIDPSVEEWMLQGYKRADEAGSLKLRVKAAVKVEGPEGVAGVARALSWKEQYASPHLAVNAIKLFVDGVIETGTAGMLEAYVGSDSAGSLLFTAEQIDAIAIAADKEGLQLHAHAIGDRAVRTALDAYEAAPEGQWRTVQPTSDHPSRGGRPGGRATLRQARRDRQHPGAVGLSGHLHRRPHGTGARARTLAMAVPVRGPEGRRGHHRGIQRLVGVVDEPAGSDPDRRDARRIRPTRTVAC